MKDVFCFGGREFAFDIFDGDDFCRLSDALRRLKDGLGRQEGGAGPVGPLISRFFDDILGDGSARLLLSGAETDGADMRMNACTCFMDYVADRCRTAEEEIGKWEKKYLSPPGEESEK